MTTEEDPDLLTVLSNDGLHGSQVGGVHHERDSLSLSDFHDSLEHQGVVVARRQCSYRHHLAKRRTASSQHAVCFKAVLEVFLSNFHNCTSQMRGRRSTIFLSFHFDPQPATEVTW